MTAKKYKAVMFDLDGTLLDTLGDIHYSINLTMNKLGYAAHTKKEVRSFINYGSKRLIELALPEDKRDAETIEQTHKIYLENYSKNVCIETKAYDGIQELVSRLKNEGYVLSVVSNKPHGQVEQLCERFFGGMFSYVSGTGEDRPVKPQKECILLALEQLGIDKDELVYVGDSNVDVKTAHNAGVVCAGVTWGFHGKGGFGDERADFYADNTAQLYSFITGEDYE